MSSKARLVCDYCGEKFERPSLKGPVPSYCKRSHRQRAYELRQTEKQIARAVAKKIGRK